MSLLRVTVMVEGQPKNGFVFEQQPIRIVVYLDEQYGKMDFKNRYIYLLADEGVHWAQGWGREVRTTLLAAHLLAESAR